MTSIRFLHIADLHLDSPFKGVYGLSEQALIELRNSTFVAFERIISHALDVQPDFMLLVGDIYDGEHRSLKAQRRFQEGMEQLSKANIPVIVCHGNHDHLSGNWTRFSLPDNVTVLPEQTMPVQLTIRGQQVNIYGFSYPERHVKRSKIDTYPVAEDASIFHIGMLHGSIAGEQTHAVYAPFTKEQLLSKGYDYWALGHIHKRQQIHQSPPIIYPGNIQSRHRNEQGVKGFYDVRLTKSCAELEFVKTSAVVYDTVKVDCTECIHANELLLACTETIAQCRERHGAIVVDIQLVANDKQSKQLIESAQVEEWLEAIREIESANQPLTWVQSISLRSPVIDEYTKNAVIEDVLSVLDSWEENNWKEVLKELYQHTASSRFLEPLSTQQIEHLKQDARQLFTNEMMK